MGGKSRSRTGLPRLMARLNGPQGYAYRAYGASLAQELGILKADFALMAEVGRVARLWVEYSEAAKVLDSARRQRESRKGKPPSMAQVDRLAHRAHVASQAYAEALAALKADDTVKARLAKLRVAETMAAARARAHASRPQPAQSFPGSLPGRRLDEADTGALEVKTALTPTSAATEEKP